MDVFYAFAFVFVAMFVLSIVEDASARREAKRRGEDWPDWL